MMSWSGRRGERTGLAEGEGGAGPTSWELGCVESRRRQRPLCEARDSEAAQARAVDVGGTDGDDSDDDGLWD